MYSFLEKAFYKKQCFDPLHLLHRPDGITFCQDHSRRCRDRRRGGVQPLHVRAGRQPRSGSAAGDDAPFLGT